MICYFFGFLMLQEEGDPMWSTRSHSYFATVNWGNDDNKKYSYTKKLTRVKYWQAYDHVGEDLCVGCKGWKRSMEKSSSKSIFSGEKVQDKKGYGFVDTKKYFVMQRVANGTWISLLNYFDLLLFFIQQPAEKKQPINWIGTVNNRIVKWILTKVWGKLHPLNVPKAKE